MSRLRGRLHRRSLREAPAGSAPEEEYIEIEPGALASVFAAPSWLRDVGLTSWLLVGVALLIAGAIWLLTLTQTIVAPVVAASVTAAVASPLVARLQRHGLPRALGAVLVMLGIAALGVGLFIAILAGVTSEISAISGQLSDATDTVAGWLEDAGVNAGTAETAKQEAGASTTAAVSSLLNGVGNGIIALSGLAFFLGLTALSLFFFLMDGPTIRAWGERHLGVPRAVARIISTRTLGALRGYFLGVTLVAAFNAAVVVLGALILGVPLVGTIGVVTFVGAYIPYLGAWGAAAFSVLIALGGAGPEAAGGMIVLQLLANSVLQQMVQPFAMGAALGIHPLAVLVVTIAGGALFGTVGLILAAPITSAVVRISDDLARASEEEAAADHAETETQETQLEEEPDGDP